MNHGAAPKPPHVIRRVSGGAHLPIREPRDATALSFGVYVGVEPSNPQPFKHKSLEPDMPWHAGKASARLLDEYLGMTVTSRREVEDFFNTGGVKFGWRRDDWRASRAFHT